MEGRLEIGLHRKDGLIEEVSILSTRPVAAVEIFKNKPVDEVLRTLPLLFSVCGVAQGVAAVQAIEQSLAVKVSQAQRRARAALLLAETVREHMLGILMAWPELGIGPADPEDFGSAGRLLPGVQNGLYPDSDAFRLGGGRLRPDPGALQNVIDAACRTIEHRILGCSIDEWLAIGDLQAFTDWVMCRAGQSARVAARILDKGWSDIGRCRTGTLPMISEHELDALLSSVHAADFIRIPEWDGSPRETTSLTRQSRAPIVVALASEHGNGLLTRLAARLSELSMAARELATLAEELAGDCGSASAGTRSGTGIAQIEAARGRLIHRVEVENGLLSRYQTVAPTEWNFHPRGLLYSAFKGWKPDGAEDVVVSAARLLVRLVDPCVEYRLTLH